MQHKVSSLGHQSVMETQRNSLKNELFLLNCCFHNFVYTKLIHLGEIGAAEQQRGNHHVQPEFGPAEDRSERCRDLHLLGN